MEKTFLVENMWTIFEVAKEERTDGDNFQGDLGVAHDLFLNGLTVGGKQYKCMADLDKAALATQWAAEDQGKARAEYKALVGNDLDHPNARKFKELTEAFSAGDLAAFEAAIEAGLANM